jgi:hypothetical protein
MNNVVESHGPCEAEKCKRPERLITSDADKVVVRKKQYHRGCEPTPQELAALDRS